MNRYAYSDEVRAALEGLQQPLAVYQLIDNQITTLLVSDGFCKLLGYAQRSQAVWDMDHDMYKDTHPDDRQRISEAALRLAAGGDDYDVVFRTRAGMDSDYRVIHAHGEHVYPREGVRLAQVWYMDEGVYIEGNESAGTPMNREVNSVLHEESILRAANYDALTGLPNLAHFFKLCEIGKARLYSEGKQACLLYFDLNGMKFYNHRYGYAEGDKLLKAFAEQLADAFGHEDCCHIGADRFAVSTEEEGMEERLNRFFDAIGRMKNHLPVRVGISNAPEGVGSEFVKRVLQCCGDSNRAFFDETMPDGSTVHAFVRRMGTNPIRGSVAVGVAVLSVSEPNEQTLIQQMLSVFEQFGEHMPGGFFIYRADGTEKLLYANRAVCDIYGCDSLEDFKALSGFTFRGMVHPEDYERVLTAIRGQVNESQSDLGSVEYRIIRRDGGIRWINEYGHYMETSLFHGLYYVFISDITDRYEKAESDKALRAAVIEALTKTYDSVWLINDMQTQRFELYRIDPEMVHLLPANAAMKLQRFSEAFAFYSKLVLESDRQRFLEAVSPESIVENTRSKPIYSVPFRRVFDTGVRYYRVEFTEMSLENGEVNIVTGFKDVDEETRKDQQLHKALREAIDAANAYREDH